MKLFSARRERQLRRTVRRDLRSCPALAQQARRRHLNLNQNIRLPPDLVRLFGTAWLLILLSGVTSGGASLAYKLSLLSLWGLALSFTQAFHLLHCLNQHPDRTPLLFLPISDAMLFHHLWSRFLARSRGVWLDFAAGYSLLLGTLGASLWQWTLVPVVATLHWLATVASAVLLHSFPTVTLRLALPLVPLLGGCFIGLMVERIYVGPAVARWLEGASGWLLILLPTGWPAMLFRDVAFHREWLSIVLLAPLGGWLWWSWLRWGTAQRQFSVADIVPARSVTGLDGEETELPELLSELQLPGTTATLDAMAQKQFLRAGFSWAQAAWLERCVLRWLNLREQLLLETLLDELPNWSRGWLRAGRCLGLGALAATAAQQWGASWFGWIDGAALFLALGLALGTGLPHGGAILSAFPVGFDELLRLKSKVWGARWACAAPLFLAYALVLCWRLRLEAPLLQGLALSLKGWCLIPAVYPYTLTASIEPGSGQTETKELRIKNLGSLLVALVCGGTTLLLVLTALVPDLIGHGGWLSWLAVPLAHLPGWLFLARYRRRFNRCRTDLLA
jgi:hypothetical protein